MEKILAVNSGSSTLKIRLFAMPLEKSLVSMLFDPINADYCNITFKQDNFKTKLHLDTAIDYTEAVELALKLLKKYQVINDFSEIHGIGHRIVAGGEKFTSSTVITDKVLRDIEALAEFAPLHNPANAKGIRATARLLPHARQVAVFDTSFHSSMGKKNFLYGLPYEYYRTLKVRKYGAHGTSHRYVAMQAAKLIGKPLTSLKLITLHLGAGASVTAIKNGKSVDTSMGFSPVSGLMMSTRSGDIDPSALFYLMHKGVIKNIDDCLNILNKKSGLLGVSETSNDMRTLEKKASEDPQAQLAIEMFVKRIVDYIGAYWLELGGADALVFTGGIGEKDAVMRERIANKLEPLNIFRAVEGQWTDADELDFTGKGSSAKLLMIPTNEELMIARDVFSLDSSRDDNKELSL
ncbi:acetate kinase [Liquorilactobacillus sucicola DSM 21376 = JCM 15457]|nr:acetate kinase [Liquorilactobacillus sucicola]GAJ26896.1 acetate kinase [Liquorilactobacillus sucicola DSM 21376 = JCM 15457]